MLIRRIRKSEQVDKIRRDLNSIRYRIIAVKDGIEKMETRAKMSELFASIAEMEKKLIDIERDIKMDGDY